eukprot:TRINITY_DN9655_c0_g2_i1.p1 TRINITY_DN9655_c0_g2~~TRINITY_DN9655_c0_g2_i1.p1  ORF type:complete len:643 (+),score=52.24 TRINITY_DN9655_c0_g2_i1:83-2011(+)
MTPERSFRIWLHQVHGNSKLSPLAEEELSRASSIDERLSVLAEVAAQSAKQLSASTKGATGVELALSGKSLQTFDLCGRTRDVLPILFSQIGFSVCTSLNEPHTSTRPAGVIALGLPLADDEVETPVGEYPPCNLWLLVVTCRFDTAASIGSKGIRENDFAMREAVAALVQVGAICNTSGADFSDACLTNVSLGEGSSAEVKLMRKRLSIQRGEQSEESTYAIKVWNARCANNQLRVFNEVRHFVEVQRHPNIGKFVGLFRSISLVETPRWLMIMEAYTSGDLHAVIRATGAFPVFDAVTCAIGLVSALVHVHSLDIIHRDVKLENVLLKRDRDVVLVDFGLAVHTSETDERMRIRGTPGSFAPETLYGKGSVKKSDVFGGGTVLYAMLAGFLPFARQDRDSTIRANAVADIVFHEDQFRNVREDIRQPVRNMLSRYPRQRLSSRSALRCLVQEKERLDVTPPGALDEADFELSDSANPCMESTARASATPEHEPLAPDVVPDSSSFSPEFGSLTCGCNAASPTDRPPSTSCGYSECGRGSERTCAPSGDKLTSRLVSTSSQALTWARRQFRRPCLRGHSGHVRDPTRISAVQREEADAPLDTLTSVVCGPGFDTSTAARTRLRLRQRSVVQWLRQSVWSTP